MNADGLDPKLDGDAMGVESPRPERPSGINSDLNSPFTRIKDELELLVKDFEEEEYKVHDQNGVETSKDNSCNNAMINDKIAVATEDDLMGLNNRRLSTGLGEASESRSLWIGNLDPNITEEGLRQIFQPFGVIESLRLLPFKECAFVNFAKIEDALKAKKQLQGRPIGNMIVRIGYGKSESNSANGYNNNNSTNNNAQQEQQPLSRSSSVGFSDAASNLAMPSDRRSVWVGQIDPDCNKETLMGAFSKFGEIESCRILEAKNCAFVNFFNANDADVARKTMNGMTLGTAKIKTGFAKNSGAAKDEIGNANTSKKRHGSDVRRLKDEFNEQDIPMSTQPVPANEFKNPVPALPPDLTLPESLNSNVIREYRRHINQVTVTSDEIDSFAKDIFDHILAASVDPVGNILVQKLIEKGSANTMNQILQILGPYMATVGIHKNGTWVVQKLINHCGTSDQRASMAHHLKNYVVPLLQDQFGNYVVQCCLAFGPNHNQFIFDALYHRCVDIATSRFGSRGMRSCLDSTIVTMQQKKFVAMALINHAVKLSHDANGVIIVQWLLDSDLPGRYSFLVSVLKGHLANLCLSKYSSSIVAKLIQSDDQTARDLVIDELFNSPNLPNLLVEPMSAAIILRALTLAKPEQRVMMAHKLEGHLNKAAFRNLQHLQKIIEETRAASEIVQLENDHYQHDNLPRLFHHSSGALLSHAVGGPVNNRAIARPQATCDESNPGSVVMSRLTNALKSGQPTTRKLTFGSVHTVLPIHSLDSEKNSSSNEDRISFGPSLLQQGFGHPPAPI